MTANKEMTKKERVLQFIKARGRVKTSEVIDLSRFLFHNRCLRDAQELAQEGLIFRMSNDLKVRYYGNIKEDVYTADPNEAERRFA